MGRTSASGERPIGATSRRQQYNQASCQPPPLPHLPHSYGRPICRVVGSAIVRHPRRPVSLKVAPQIQIQISHTPPLTTARSLPPPPPSHTARRHASTKHPLVRSTAGAPTGTICSTLRVGGLTPPLNPSHVTSTRKPVTDQTPNGTPVVQHGPATEPLWAPALSVKGWSLPPATPLTLIVLRPIWIPAFFFFAFVPSHAPLFCCSCFGLPCSPNPSLPPRFPVFVSVGLVCLPPLVSLVFSTPHVIKKHRFATKQYNNTTHHLPCCFTTEGGEWAKRRGGDWGPHFLLQIFCKCPPVFRNCSLHALFVPCAEVLLI